MREGAPPGRAAVLREARDRLAAAGIETAALDARHLLLDAAGLEAADLARAPEAPLAPAAAARFEAALARRLAGEPVARILGAWEFWGLPFALSARTLVPRADTETVVEAALAGLGPRRGDPLAILDLGTGSGALLVALLAECPRAFGLGTDRDPGALVVARANARANGVAERARFVAADWAAPLSPPSRGYDLVVSNPPYIRSAEIPDLPPEVRADPPAALDGGLDGLEAYRAILAAAPGLLGASGLLVVEIGHDQEEDLAHLAPAHRLIPAGLARDLAGRPRAVTLRAAAPGPRRGPDPAPRPRPLPVPGGTSHERGGLLHVGEPANVRPERS